MLCFMSLSFVMVLERVMVKSQRRDEVKKLVGALPVLEAVNTQKDPMSRRWLSGSRLSVNLEPPMTLMDLCR